MHRRIVLLGCLAASAAGCRSEGVALYDMEGNQWVWPYFLQGQPQVIAFWNTDEIECINDLASLNTLDMREGPVGLVSVCTSPDRLAIRRWMRKENVRFEVLHDPDEKLASRLGVDSYPTYLFFDIEGHEIGRSLTIRTIQNWFDRPRHIRRATLSDR